MISAADITRAVRELGIRPEDTVFVHSDVSRCLRVEGFGREQKLDTIIRGLADSVPDGTLIMPTFSYSFCRRELFEIARSPSTVGVLTERFRTRPGVRRTADPIFSSAILGSVAADWEQDLFAVQDNDCFGPRSIFAYLLAADAQHLCLGTTAYTMVHHIEQRERVPYRYFKDFRGVVADASGLSLVTARYFVRPLEDEFEAMLFPLVDALRERGDTRTTSLERGPSLCATRARSIDAAVLDGLRCNPDFLLQRGHRELSRTGNA